MTARRGPLRRRTTGHTQVSRGKRVIVYMQDGTRFINKFFENNKRSITFMDGSTVRRRDVATLTIYKGGDATSQSS